MNTVTFGNKNSYADFGLILDHKEIGKPEPRTNYIDVPARDGHLDLTEAFGEVKYKERKLVFYFSYIGSDANWSKTLSALHNYINGQKLNIYFEEDYYWVGRCFVGDAQTQKGIREFTIECDCEPYKRKLQDTIVETKRKNLIVMPYASGGVGVSLTDHGVTFSVNEDNSINMSGTNDSETVGSRFTLFFSDSLTLEAGTYTISVSHNDGFCIEENGTWFKLLDYGKKTNTFTLTEAKTFKRIYILISKNYASIETTNVFVQLEKGANATAYEPYDTDIVNILNDRKTVTPKITTISGEPILSWTDKKTGTSFQNALPNNFNNKILDFKLYEGNNTFTVKGGDIRLTYREASL